MKRLLLFDIDGTLVYSNRTGRIAVEKSLARVFGTAGAIGVYDFAGKTDRRIVRDLMVDEGFSVSEIEDRFPAFMDQMARFGEELFTPERIKPCPGVMALLSALRTRGDAVLALLTGNIHSTAPLKLKAGGIDPDWFQAGAYGSDSIERNDLVAIAVERVYRAVGIRFAEQDVVVLGDTPADIRCARAANSRAIAVATGPIPAEDLRQHNPDHLFNDFSTTSAVLQAVFDGLATPG